MRPEPPDVETFPVRGFCPDRLPRCARYFIPRVEGVLQAVAQEVEGDQGHENQEARVDRERLVDGLVRRYGFEPSSEPQI